ncbi:MAG: hypothetical protein EB056_03215 [Verrucomicrobia bacterium]|nr:hypothetical protein [Verrucomicrobiota bacterium]
MKTNYPALSFLILLFSGLASGWGAEIGTVFTVKAGEDGEVAARVAAGRAEFVPVESSSGIEIGAEKGFSSSTGQVTSLGSTDDFAGLSMVAADARSEDGKSVAASSMAPSEGGGPGDVATAAGAESTAAGTETAAGNTGNTGVPATQAPVPPVNTSGNSGSATPV